KSLIKTKVLDENLVNELRRFLTFGNKDNLSINRRTLYSEHETIDDDQRWQWGSKPTRSILKSLQEVPSPTKHTSLPIKYESNDYEENTIHHHRTTEKRIYKKNIIELANDDEYSHFHYNGIYLPEIRHDSGYSSQYERSHLQQIKLEIPHNHNEYLTTFEFDRFADFTPTPTTSLNIDSDFLEPIVTDPHLLKNLSPIVSPSSVYYSKPLPFISSKTMLNEKLVIRDNNNNNNNNNNTNVHPLLENEFDMPLLNLPPPVPDRSLKPAHLRPKPGRLIEIPTRKHQIRQTSSDGVSTWSVTSSILTNNITSSIDDSSFRTSTPQQSENQFERYNTLRKLLTTTADSNPPTPTPNSSDLGTTSIVSHIISHTPIAPKPRQSLLNKQNAFL
ncbi:unnamed protein product, partial [Didymodactylos carnosus]